MTEKEFILDAGTFTAHISYFEGPTPGRYSGPPEDCYPDEGAEIEFDDKVEYADEDDGTTIKTMPFDDFVKLYAKEHTDGNEDKALDRIENETITDIMDQAGEYEP